MQIALILEMLAFLHKDHWEILGESAPASIRHVAGLPSCLTVVLGVRISISISYVSLKSHRRSLAKTDFARGNSETFWKRLFFFFFLKERP